jgi:hypothetical protein
MWSRDETFDEKVGLAAKGRLGAVIPDDSGSAGYFVAYWQLAGKQGVDGCVIQPSCSQPRPLGRERGGDHDNGVKVDLATGFKEQRYIREKVPPGRLAVRPHLLPPGSHGRVENALQAAPGRTISENDASQGRPADLGLLVKNLVAERGGHHGDDLRVFGQQLVNTGISVEELKRMPLPEKACESGFARARAAGESENHDWKSRE